MLKFYIFLFVSKKVFNFSKKASLLFFLFSHLHLLCLHFFKFFFGRTNRKYFVFNYFSFLLGSELKSNASSRIVK